MTQNRQKGGKKGLSTPTTDEYIEYLLTILRVKRKLDRAIKIAPLTW